MFDTLAKEFIGVEESHNIDRDAIPQMLKDIQGVESAVVREAVFSENEEFEDIDELHLK